MLKLSGIGLSPPLQGPSCTLVQHNTGVQNWLFIVHCVQVASPGTLIVVFTDNGSKDLFLEEDIIKLRERKRCEVSIQN